MSTRKNPSTPTPPAVNRHGYFVTSRLYPGEVRTYACTDKAALGALLLHLTGRTIDTFVEDERGVPRCSGLSIAYPCHIYGAQEIEPYRNLLLQIAGVLDGFQAFGALRGLQMKIQELLEGTGS